MSEIRMFGFQTVPKSEQKPVRISARSDFRHLGHTQNVRISAFSDFKVSEIRTLERIPLASKWKFGSRTEKNVQNPNIFVLISDTVQNPSCLEM